MAKLTDERITLPDFEMPMVHKVDGKAIIDTLNLKSTLANSQKGLILYFYPKDNTSGCTIQAIDFTSMLNDFNKLGYNIIGVSRDSIDSHKKFIEKHNLNIPLLSDKEERLCQYFDVIKEKNMYGKKVMGLVRSTFVFNKDSTLTHAQRNLRAKGYAERLYETLTTQQ